MKILHVVPTYLPALRYGGPIYSVHGLGKATAGRGHEVHVFTTSVDGDMDSDVPLRAPVNLDGVKVWYFPSRVLRRLYYSPGMSKALKRRVGQFDIVHLHSVFLWPTWAAARAARRAQVPYVLSPRGMLDKALLRRKSRWLKTLWIRFIEKHNLQNAEAVHVTSEVEKRALQEFGLRLKRIINVPNGVDAPVDVFDSARISEDIKRMIEQRDYVLYLGRIHWKKGLDRLVDAWAGAGDCRLVIAGNDEEGYARRLEDRARANRSRNIEFIVRTVSDADKDALYRHARLFVLPSYSENFGNTVLEAMLRGVPVIVTEEVGAAEVVAAARCGQVVNGASLADAIKALLSDVNGAREMGRRGRDFATRHCTWDAAAGSMIRAYAACAPQAGDTNP